MPKKTISKRKVSHLSYIVPASGTDQWITPEDLEVARIQRDAQYVYARGDDVTINGFKTTANKERGDRNMTHQFMAYLASTAVTPMEADTPFCSAFSHTSNLTPVATVDRTCMSFRAPHLAFDTDKFLKQVMTEEIRDNDGMFAPFAAKHVKKVIRIVPNMEILTPNGIAGKYHVEMCILTGMGILVARGHLHIPRDQMETVEKMHVGSIKPPEISRNSLDLADKVCVHLGQGKPALVQADNLAVPDHSGDRGWKISDAFDFASCTTLPDLISGATNGRTNADERTCFVNDLGLGLQFAVVAGVTLRLAESAGIGQVLPTELFTQIEHP